jgi:hypothetical protein
VRPFLPHTKTNTANKSARDGREPKK